MYYCVVYREFLWPISISNGFSLQIFWNLLDGKLKPKCNEILSVIELWTHSQGSKTLSEWLTYVYNLVEICDYGYSKDTIIRDVLIFGCNSDKGKEKIVQQGKKISLNRVIEILRREDSAKQVLLQMNSTVQKIHCVSYEKKRYKGTKPRNHRNSKIILSHFVLLLVYRIPVNS